MRIPMVTILAAVMSFMGVAMTTPLLMILTFTTSVAAMALSSMDKMVINQDSLLAKLGISTVTASET